jgi:hypothetical protein
MKKSVLLITVIIAAALLFSCAGGKESAPQQPKQETADTSNLPDFVLNPPVATDAIYGVGFAQQSTLPLSIKVAEANARADIANQIDAQIKSAVTSYAQEAGVGDDTQVIEFAETITRQVTDTTLSGAITKQRAPMEDGGVWILMVYSKESLLGSFEEAAESFERNEGAAFAEFKASQALDKLEYETQNNPTTSQPVKGD